MDGNLLRHIARLARLELGVGEIERMTRDLKRLLSDIELLRAAADAPEALPPAATVSAPNGVAAFVDVPADQLKVAISHIAPEWREGFFTVPRTTPSVSDRGTDE